PDAPIVPADAPIVPVDAPIVPAVDSARGREHALALGGAVHEVLERVPLGDESGLDELAVRAATAAGLTGEAERVAMLARACWRAAPLRAAARAAAGPAGIGCHRELPVCVRHGGSLIEGAIDLVYRDDGLNGWVVVDYKTDARTAPEAVFERYGGQAGAYALAFEAASGERVVAVAVLLAALPGKDGAATVVELPVDERLRELVEARLAAPTQPVL
ncbi:MAG TPA: PD-(D/E)XK nuclease family protein, partial [Thermoleophilia bacterium]|nr:PD-(D/E)XK nuclease family protein [Thermoleophilia bacterium]